MSRGSRSKEGRNRDCLPAWKERALRLRAGLLGAVRDWFSSRGYLEVETPIIVSTPIPEPHIDFIETAYGALQPSPEVFMKRLLSAGHSRIFQIARCFRDHERGDRHLREFSLLEWYRAGADYLALMEECEEMVRAVAGSIGVGPSLTYLGRVIRLDVPWKKMTLAEAFDRYSPESLEDAMSSGSFEELLVSHVEPFLGTPCPVFLHDYPASMASLSRLKDDDPGVCERVELYMGGMEIANGFSELTDRREQLLRFHNDLMERESLGRKLFGIPESFLDAVEQMPASAGMALGVERLIMVLADFDEIGNVVAFTPEEE